MGMAGGGKDSLIGVVHRVAAQMDGDIELVCGAFSSTRQKARESGLDLRLPPDRVYNTYREMFRREAKLAASQRMDFVSIVTPNNMHYPVSMAALDGGFHVVCEKPMTLTLDEAQNLARKINQTGRLFCVTHNLTGIRMVREAREMVAGGSLGRVRRVVVEHPQGWLASRLETTGHKQAAWRTDPRRMGASGCISDIGEHCAFLAEYVTGSPVSEVSADLTTFVKGRPLDDDGSVLLRFGNGSTGVLWVSQIAVGEMHGLRMRVYGEKGTVEWRESDANALRIVWADRPTEVIRRVSPSSPGMDAGGMPLPGGRLDSRLDSFAVIYRSFAKTVGQVLSGQEVAPEEYGFPGVKEGTRGVLFLEAVRESVHSQAKWIKVGS